MKIIFDFRGHKNKGAVINAMVRHIKTILSSGGECIALHDEGVESELNTALENVNCNIIQYSRKSAKELNDVRNFVFCPDIYSVLKAKVGLSRCKVIYWIQGELPQESKMKNQGLHRFALYTLLEYFSYKVADTVIFVSDYMKEYYEDKYSPKESHLVIPCSSDFRYEYQEKIKNSFCYVGGMSAWQKVDRMIEIFSNIVSTNEDATLHIATRDVLELEDVLKRVGVSEKVKKSIFIYSFKSPIEVNEFLNDKEFGFLLRDESIVNAVASPIKLAEYLSCGMKVIMSPAVKSYYESLKNTGAIISEHDDVTCKINEKFSPTPSLKAAEKHFSTYNHAEKYRELFLK
ncbi:MULTISPECIES: glycosyltransferase family 4 protein [Pseudomonadati]|uniref:glycosyltransferase family 4 protein n=1 Tax=Pseudomonadati TaxID=3379134 RepID=UPI0013DFB169|nr:MULTISPECIES: glycosyltransferase family 4 protein [Vibrio]MDW2022525.1 hypothetical protein [Vibrio sp. 397]MDW2027494.1 hypothetical protein [Vibrio sp. 399]MDW2213672.1 hypothetical protein [Vibrio sp. 1982]QOV30127.1 hypothetical protein INT50_01075 [Vibrio diabolicus]